MNAEQGNWYDGETGKRNDELAADGKPGEYAVEVNHEECPTIAEVLTQRNDSYKAYAQAQGQRLKRASPDLNCLLATQRLDEAPFLTDVILSSERRGRCFSQM